MERFEAQRAALEKPRALAGLFQRAPVGALGDTVWDGSGTINGDLTNAGVINVGGTGAIGILTVNGNFTQTGTGSLKIQIGGSKAGTDFDQLVITGLTSLDGALNVTLINGFNPNPGDSFQILTFTGSSGNFATTSLPPGGSVKVPFDGTVSF